MIFAPDMPRSVTILGATGSVGANTLDLISKSGGALCVEAVTANSNVEALARIARESGARYAAIAKPELYKELKRQLDGTGIETGGGPESLEEAAARPADRVMGAIVGAAGLAPVLRAVRNGSVVALANKEALVCAGSILVDETKRTGSVLLPVDSEHNAIHQVFDYDHADAVEKIILTASGGPFRKSSLDEMESSTPEEAVRHPNWDMGAKISVDSATMMNKGLELIEASHLFPVGEERIEILVHPESIIHSMVAYSDGSILAQLGTPDMRTPIAYTLAWPERMHNPAPRLDFVAVGNLNFEAPDLVKFRALVLAREALRAGGGAPIVLNAANEVAVKAFLAKQIGFGRIVPIIEDTLETIGHVGIRDLDDVYECDRRARQDAAVVVSKWTS